MSRGLFRAFALCVLAGRGQIAEAQQRDWMLGPFTKPIDANPVITPRRTNTFLSPMNDSSVYWEEYATFNPAAVVRDDKVYLLYRAEDATGEAKIGHHTSRLGLAESTDGLHFAPRPTPVLYPDKDEQSKYEWTGGVEDPRIVESEDGTYVLTYTQWNRDVPRLAVATSKDLLNWRKHGPAFAKAYDGKYLNREAKSGAILSRVQGSRVIATKVNGKYWMYYGVPDIQIATSENLTDWTPLEDTDGKPVKVLSPRPGYFDSWLVEGGPPAILTPRGIVVLYNAGNSGSIGDPRLPEHVYTGGQALFDAGNPIKLLDRAPDPFIRPTEPYERTGQYVEGTTFVEGLVPFSGQWLLYYGTADSRVGVAVWRAADEKTPAARRIPVIVIDPGHPSEVSSGGEVQNGTTEVHVAWLVALELRKMLRARGYKVVLTKSSERQFVRNVARAKVGNRERADLVVRLHCDASSDSGFALYFPDREGTAEGRTGPSPTVRRLSQSAAESLHVALAQRLAGRLRDGGVRGDSKTSVGGKQGALTGSIVSVVPVVLIEMVTLSNAHDARMIKSAAGRSLMAKAIADGIERYVPGKSKISQY